MSGDMNTSMGNKIIMCLMAKAYIDSVPFPIEFVNNGDDCLMITDKRNLHKLEGINEYFAKFGFNIVRETPVYELEQVEFCQSKPICANGIWRMVRNVRTCISKDVTCVSLGHNFDEYRAWLYDVGRCGLATASDVPILGDFYRFMVRMGNRGYYASHGHKEYTWYYTASKDAHCKFDTPDEDARYSFWLSTGISPDQQVVIEDMIKLPCWGANERQLINDLSILLNG